MTNGTIHGWLSTQYHPRRGYFFTVTLLDRASRLLVERIDELLEVFRAVRP